MVDGQVEEGASGRSTAVAPLSDGYPPVKISFEIAREVILCLSMDLDHKLLLVNKLISSRF